MSRLTPENTKTYHATSPTIVRISLADAFSAEVPVTPRIPAFVHHDFLNEAEVFIFEHQGITLFCKSFIVFYRLCLKNPLVFALVR